MVVLAADARPAGPRPAPQFQGKDMGRLARSDLSPFSQTAVAGHAEPEPALQPSPRPVHTGQLKPLGRTWASPCARHCGIDPPSLWRTRFFAGFGQTRQRAWCHPRDDPRCGARRHPGSRGVARRLAAAGKPVSLRALRSCGVPGYNAALNAPARIINAGRGDAIPSETISLAGR